MLNTGHSIFDYLCPLKYGESALILDGTPTGAIRFLEGIFSNREKGLEVYMVSTRPIEPPPSWHFTRIDLRDLTEVQILVSKVKDKIGGGIIIHDYLPELLTLFDEKSVLKFLEVMKQRSQSGIFEFYIIPLNAFESFEKKVMSLVPFVVELSVREVDKNPLHRLIVRKNPDSDYGLIEYPYLTQGGKVLIKFGETYSENLTTRSSEDLLTRIKEYADRSEAYRIQLVPGRGKPLEFVDHQILATINGRTFTEVKELFPENMDEVFKKVLLLEEEGVVRIEEVNGVPLSPAQINAKLPRTFQGSMALTFPARISRRLLRSPKGIPLDIYKSLQEIFLDFILYISRFHKISPTDEDLVTYIDRLSFKISEINARMTTVQRLKEMGEDLRGAMDIKYVPKLVKLTLAVTARISADVYTVTDGEFKVVISGNPFISSGGRFPACSIIRGAVVGAVGICFKRKAHCEEVRCKAKGASHCEFTLRIE